MSQPMHPFYHDRAVAKLREIAKAKLAEHEGQRYVIQSSDEILSEVSALSSLLEEVFGTAPADTNAAISTLFEEQALEIIKDKIRNKYWFWYVLSHLRTRRIAVKAAPLARAVARAADSIRERRYGFEFIPPTPLEWHLKQLPPGFLAEMILKGRVLVVTGRGEYSVTLNPLLIED